MFTFPQGFMKSPSAGGDAEVIQGITFSGTESRYEEQSEDTFGSHDVVCFFVFKLLSINGYDPLMRHMASNSLTSLEMLLYTDNKFKIDQQFDLCELYSKDAIVVNTQYSLFYSRQASTGNFVFEINGVDADDTVHTNRAVASGDTRMSAINNRLFVGAALTPSENVQMGFFCFDNNYLTNPEDFFDSIGGAYNVDDTGWTEWGGTQPLVWARDGDMLNHTGRWASAFTDTWDSGNITGPTNF